MLNEREEYFTFVRNEYKRKKSSFIVVDNDKILRGLKDGDTRTIARAITSIENDLKGSRELLMSLPSDQPNATVVGITGPPGAGKSTLVNALLHAWTDKGKRVAVLLVDPSSPFNFGALLGDRIRMSDFYLNPLVYIRSLASRGALGGLNHRIIEIVALLKACPFDYILIETVGVGQSEVEIAGIADTTLVVVVPEAGDEIQTMKAGVMEIVDIFVVNKSDREQASELLKHLKALAHHKAHAWEIPVIAAVATEGKGLDELLVAIEQHQSYNDKHVQRKLHLLTEKVWQLIQHEKMKDYDFSKLAEAILLAHQMGPVNIFQFAQNYRP